MRLRPVSLPETYHSGRPEGGSIMRRRFEAEQDSNAGAKYGARYEASWWGALILVAARPLRSLVAMAYHRVAGAGTV